MIIIWLYILIDSKRLDHAGRILFACIEWANFSNNDTKLLRYVLYTCIRNTGQRLMCQFSVKITFKAIWGFRVIHKFKWKYAAHLKIMCHHKSLFQTNYNFTSIPQIYIRTWSEYLVWNRNSMIILIWLCNFNINYIMCCLADEKQILDKLAILPFYFFPS